MDTVHASSPQSTRRSIVGRENILFFRSLDSIRETLTDNEMSLILDCF